MPVDVTTIAETTIAKITITATTIAKTSNMFTVTDMASLHVTLYSSITADGLLALATYLRSSDS